MTRVVFCGDREVGARVAALVRASGAEIVAVGVNEPPHAVDPDAVVAAAGVDPSLVFYGRGIATEVARRKLAALGPDLGICCGFASIVPRRVLDLCRWGWVNAHRSYLPYNRGLNPLAWAVVDGTPAGVSLHVMTEAVDAGDVLAQAQMPVHLTDNATSLEARADALVYDLFEQAWPRLREGDLSGTPQDEDLASYHSVADCESLYRLDPDETMTVRRLLDILRTHSGDRGSAIDLRVGGMRYTAHLRILRMVQTPGAAPAPGLGTQATTTTTTTTTNGAAGRVRPGAREESR
jgi:methionyl-tRNA formyltransferase